MSDAATDIAEMPDRAALPKAWYRASMLGAVVSGAFCIVLAGVMLLDHVRGVDGDPTDSPALVQARQQLAAQPRDQQRLESYRTLDLQMRHRYFREQQRNQRGAWLLIAGLVVFVASSRVAAQRYAPLLVLPDEAAPTDSQERQWANATVTTSIVAAGLVVGAIALGVTGSERARWSDDRVATSGGAGQSAVDGDGTVTPAPAWPSEAELKANWPRFRGHRGAATATVDPLPTAWDAATGENIIWRAPIELPGANSPVVWGDRVVLTGASAQQRVVYCFSATDGKPLWQTPIITAAGRRELDEVFEDTGYAAPTVATDGQRVYAIFPTGDLAAVNLADGSVVWAKDIGPIQSMYTFATSLMTWRDLLLVQLDQDEGMGATSALIAYDSATGEQRWRVEREVGSSWATPILVGDWEDPHLITLATPFVHAYRVADGSEVWRVDLMGPDVAPSPVAANDRLIVSTPWEITAAIRLGGSGDVTESHIVWESDELVPDITSPVTDGQRVFTITTDGVIACLSLEDGSKLWEHELGEDVNASPSIVNGKLMVVTMTGRTVLADVADGFKLVGEGKLGEAVRASPAFAGERVFIRGKTTLWCVGTKQ